MYKKINKETLKRSGFSDFDIFILEKMFGKELAITENSILKNASSFYAYSLIDWLCARDSVFAEVVAKLECREIDENLSKLFFEYL